MTELTLTRHAETRLSQRALQDTDISFLIGAATPLAANEWLFTNADVEREVAKHKRQIQRLERLRDVKVVVNGNAIITRRALRRGRTRSEAVQAT